MFQRLMPSFPFRSLVLFITMTFSLREYNQYVSSFVVPFSKSCTFTSENEKRTEVLKRMKQFPNVLFSTNDDDVMFNVPKEGYKKRKKRIRRKEVVSSTNNINTKSTIESKEVEDLDVDDYVGIEIKNIGKDGTSSSSQKSELNSSSSNLENILADAKRFRNSEKDNNLETNFNSEKDNNLETNFNIRSTISTLLTIDFFLVVGFLFWFLTGVFVSNVLNNDTVQIAFNNIFQPIVQPALGILMIGSVASGSLGKEEE